MALLVAGYLTAAELVKRTAAAHRHGLPRHPASPPSALTPRLSEPACNGQLRAMRQKI
jgi:hypothetical protein